MNNIERLTDEVLNEYATRFIYNECWHKFPVCDYSPAENRFCENCGKSENILLPNRRFTRNHTMAFELVEVIKNSILEACEKDEEFIFDYKAFAIHIKNSCLISKHYANPQYLHFEDFFMLYLIKPRQIVEACLLAVDYEKLIK